MSDLEPQINPTRIRIGLALIGVILVAAVILFFVADDGLGQAIFFAVALVCIVRMWLLVRWLRRQRADPASGSGTAP